MRSDRRSSATQRTEAGSSLRFFCRRGLLGKNTDRPAFRRDGQGDQDADGSIAAVVVTAGSVDPLAARSVHDQRGLAGALRLQSGGDPRRDQHVRAGVADALPFLAIIGQIERQNTAERCGATIQHIRAQGGHYGKVPFGFATVKEGKLTKLVPDPETHPWLEKAIGWYREGVSMAEISRRLNEARVRPRYGRIREWTLSKIYELLRTMQVHRSRSVISEARYDKREAYTTAYRLRCDGHTPMPFIAARLNADGLRPLKAAQYTWHSVQDLLRSAVYHDQQHAARAGAVSEGTGPQPARNLCGWRRPGTFRSAVGGGIRRR